MKYKYGDTSGYSTPNLERLKIESRTGLSALNPAGAQAMVKEIDRLEELVEYLRQEVSSASRAKLYGN